MHPLSNQTGRKLTAFCVLVASVPLVLFLREASERFPARDEDSSSRHVSVRAVDAPLLKLQDSRPLPVIYRGDPDAAALLQNRTAQPRSLASADFDQTGIPDVVAGYAAAGGGVIALQRGNPDAYAPSDAAVFARLQQGYDPAPLLPWADVYRIPVSADFLVAGNFNRDADADVLVAARHGGLYLLAGDGAGGLGAPQPIALPGVVTALAAGQFGAADASTTVAVGVSEGGSHSLLIFDDAPTGLANALVQQPLPDAASAIEFGGLDGDPFIDVVAAAGGELVIVHGWGRHTRVTASSRVERVHVGAVVRGLAVGEFVWDREGRSEIAALSDDGAIHVYQNARSDTRPYSPEEAAERTRGRFRPAHIARAVDIESLPSWQPARADGWRAAHWLPAGDCEGPCEGTNFTTAAIPLLKTQLSYRTMHDLMVIGGSHAPIEILHPEGPWQFALSSSSVMGDLRSTPVAWESAPVAVLTLPRKLNGVTEVLMLSATGTELSALSSPPDTTITVDRTDDPSGAALTAASACTAAANDCSLRGAFQFANGAANNNTTISLPAGTYILSINGTSTNGCSDNANGDLAANQSMSLVGAGSETTIIRQTGTGPANDGDRIMCMNETFLENLVYNFSGVTLTGGRDGASGGSVQVFGGGGIIGGEKGNSLTLTDVTFVNNWTVGPGLGGGAIQITGGDLTIKNSTFGGSSAPGLYTDRASLTNANFTGTSGAGVNYTPSAPMHTGGTGILTVTGTTFTRNVADSVSAGGGGADLYILAFASPGGIGSGSATFSTSTFSTNHALANGGGIVVESLPTTVATTTFTSNSAGNRGGGIYVGGGSLLLDGTSPTVTFSGNTATNGGSSVSTASATSVSGTNVVIGGDIEITTGGSWTNNTGSTLAPTNVVIEGGTLTMNNSTMNVGGNLSIGPGVVVGGTFNGNSGTVNLAGNFTFTSGGSGPATSFSAGTGTFNFNGTGAQSISNSASITFNNLTVSNVTQPLTLNNSLAVNGTLNVSGANAILSPVAAAVISGTGTLTGTGTARASRIAATADFLTQYALTNKTLTNLTIDYNGAGAQIVNNTPAYSHLVISGSGTKTLQGNTAITGNLTIGSALASGSANFILGGNWTNNGAFTAGTGTVTFAGAGLTQTLAGNTTFFNLTLSNAGTTNFGATTTTIGNDLVAAAGTMDGGTSTVIFTGVTDNAGAIGGAAAKNFHNLQINSPATISNSAGGDITIEGNYSNAGTFTQAAALATIFATDNNGDGAHTFALNGATTFGNVTIDSANSVSAGAHGFTVAGPAFTAAGSFASAGGTVSFTGTAAQTITGDGAKSFSSLLINNASGVALANGASAVDASASGVLTLQTDLTVAAGAILQQSGTSAGVGDVLGTVRRTDLGVAARSFGNPNNAVTIDSGTAPTQLDFHLAKTAPGTFPSDVKVVPRTITLTPAGGSGISATVKLRYLDPAELIGGGINESSLALWKNVGGTWIPQGGTPDTTGNFVSHSGISSFSEWAIAEASDLTVSKANSVGGTAVTGQAWNWTLTAANTGAPATFAAGHTILIDNLPSSNLTYGTPAVQNVSNIAGSANINCAIVGSDLTCTASGGSVTFDSAVGASSFSVVFSATPQAAGSYQNPRSGGGVAQIDPNNVVVERNESNNAPAANTVTVGKAATTTAIASDDPDPSVVGQPVTVQWNVTVDAPGSAGAALTGNVTVSDGTNQCVAAVSAGQCDVTFTSAGAKSITATYAGDANYVGSGSTPATSHQVGKADTTTTITSDEPDSSTPGQSVTVTWTVTVDAPGAGTPAGDVTVSDGVDSCSAAVAAGECTVALNTTGTRTLTATYAGDTNFNTSADTESHQVCPSTVVTSTADSGAGSLRQIVADACEGSVVTFDSAGVFATPQTIALTSGELLLDKNLTITGPGARVLTIDGTGASRSFSINPSTTVALSGMTLANGMAATGGGAIRNAGGTLTVTGATFSNNSGGSGGAIQTVADGVNASSTIISSTFTANTATTGGAIANVGTGGGVATLTVVNSTISGNAATEGGGGIFNGGAAGTLTILNTTITNNRADSDGSGAVNDTGGGLHIAAGPVVVRNSIVAGNFLGASPATTADDVTGTIETAANNVIAVNPMLGPLANNGGPTNTHALLINSPALDGGDNAAAATLTTDQRGFGRVRDSADPGATATVDIGAYEADPTIEDIANQSTAEDVALVLNFRTGDDTIAFDSITATSSNTVLVPNAALVIGGSGSDRTLTATPTANLSGVATITLTVQKTIGGATQTMSDTFDLTVTSENDPPTLNAIADPAPIAEDSGQQSVDFSGVSAGGGEMQTLVVTAASGNVALIPHPAVIYTSPNATGSLSYTPVPDAFGTAVITVTVSDGMATTSRTFTVTVDSVDDVPTIGAVGDQTIDEDTPTGALPFTIGDSDGLSGLTLTASSTNTTLIPDANLVLGGAGANRTITVTPAADRSGSAVITLTVDDGTSSASTMFTVTVTPVNDPPTLNAIPDPAAILEDAGLQSVSISGIGAGGIGETDTLSVSAVSSNPGLIPHPTVSYTSPAATGSLSYTPVADANGTAVVTVTVSDGALTAVRSFAVDVTAVDDTPTIGTVADQAIDEDTSTGALPFTVADPDGLAGLTVTATSSNTTLVPAANLTLGGMDGNRLITATPAPDRFGSTTITLTVNDGVSSASSSFVLTVNPVNDAPTLDAIADPEEIAEDSPLQTVALTGIGSGGIGEGDTLVVTAASDNTALIPHPTVSYSSPGSTGSLGYTPVLNANGSATITVTVSDGLLSTTRSFVVRVGAVNDAPTISAIANQTTAEDVPIGPLAFTIDDVDGLDGLSVSAVSTMTTLVPNRNLTIGGSGGNRSISISPAPNQFGTTTITVTVTDGTASAASAFVLTVTAVNDPPTITAIGNQALRPDGSTGPLPFAIDDPEGLGGLAVTATSSNPAVIPSANVILGGGGANRTVTVTAAGNIGSSLITVAVSDGTLSASTTFTVTVEAAPRSGPRISSIADQRTFAGRTLGPLAFTIEDDDTPVSSLTVTAETTNELAVPQSAIALGGSGSARTITLAIPSRARGVAQIRLIVSDGGQSASTTFVVTVDGAPLAPFDLRAAVRDRRIVDLSWRIPTEDTLSPQLAATSFRIEVGSASGRSDVRTFTTGVTTTFSIADLPPGTYFIRVIGINEAGASDPSNEVRVMLDPSGPDAPQRLRATIAGSVVQLDWEPPLDGRPVSGYQVEASYLINLTSIGVLNTIEPQLVVDGVGNGVYYARVRGIRDGGLTSASNEVVLIVGPDSCSAPPNPPAGIAIRADGNFVAAQWLSPAGAQPVDRYILSVGTGPGLSDRGAFEFNSTTSSAGAVVSDGTYVVRVAAANRCGTSAPSAEASVTVGGPPPELPGAPSGLAATVAGSTVRLDWAAPISGGAPTRYLIELMTVDGEPIGSLDTGNSSMTFTYEGAPAGVYVIRVRAANGAGVGAPSATVVVTVGP